MENNVNILSDKFYDEKQIQVQVLVKKLAAFFKDSDKQAVINYDYMLKGELDSGNMNPDVLIISPIYGLIIIDSFLPNVNRDQQLDKKLDRLLEKENVIFGNLIKRGDKSIKGRRRELKINLDSILYAPNLDNLGNVDGEQIVHSASDLIKKIKKENRYTQMDKLQLKSVTNIIDYAGGMLKPEPRQVKKNDTKGFLLNKVEEEISSFDEEQHRAALSEVNGPQRIRGLAGSGKTVILCMKVATMHAKYPEKKILYTFMTKSLYDFAKTLITRFYRLISDDGTLPDFENKISILHAWGGRSYPGVYYKACRNNDIQPLTFRDVKNSEDPFNAVCCDLLDRTQGRLKSMYDYVFIDEAQDFRPEFYQVCRELTRDDAIVWAYDELQNIYDVKLQNPTETFKNKYGAKGIDLALDAKEFPGINNDIVLHKSYRNPMEILLAAQAVGFGIYASRLVQTIKENEQWEDLGYRVLKGNGDVDDEMSIERPKENSPLSITSENTSDDLLQISSFDSMNEEVNKVSQAIVKDIKTEGLRPEDIVVISIDDKYARTYFESLELSLSRQDINTYNLLGNNYSMGFSKKGAVTLSTVYKAKGNEAGAVYIIGADAFESKSSDIKMRDKIFVAMTRTKGWLKISGVKIEDGTLKNEIKQLQINNYKLNFIQQNVEKIQRDVAAERAKRVALQEAEESIKKAKNLGATNDELGLVDNNDN